MADEVHIWQRLEMLKKKAAERYKIAEEKCHLGHVVLEGLLENPEDISQIDAATDQSETYKSVATRSTRMASALKNFGLKIGDRVLISGFNHLNLVIPFYACNYNGYSLCAADPNIDPNEYVSIIDNIRPKITFYAKASEETIKEAFRKNNLEGYFVCLDDEENSLEKFIVNYKGTEVNFRPAEFDSSKVVAWYMLTSGTTGKPKAAIIPFDTVLNAVGCWWEKFTANFKIVLTLTTIQFVSSLFFFVSGPLRHYTRLQSSVLLKPHLLVALINKYKPNVTAWTPYLLNQFLKATENVCDFSSFRYIAIGGSAIDKPLVDRFKERCNAYLYLVYGMTELLVPVFNFVDETPFGSTGLPIEKYQYKLVDDDGNTIDKPNGSGELWLKGDAFFKGYLNSLDETKKVMTDDGWVKTGDIFYQDDKNFYYFVERKRMLLKYSGVWVSPYQLEEAIKQHPDVADVCVVGIPDPNVIEIPVAAIVRKGGVDINLKEVFDLIAAVVPEKRRLHEYFYIDALPVTPSGKVHRAKLRDIAMATPRLTYRE